MAIPSKRAVLLLAHGTPETIDDIPEYLKNVVSGRPMPQHVVEEIQHRYAEIGKSPLTELTFVQARLLSESLGLPVYVGMRNWRPYIVDTVKQMRADGITECAAICLAPQNSRTSVGLYRRAAFAEAGDNLKIEFIEAWADHPLLAEAFSENLRAIWLKACAETGSKVPVLFTAHSVPCRTIQTPGQPGAPAGRPSESAPASAEHGSNEKPSGFVRPQAAERSYALPASAAQGPDPYPVEAKRTAALVAARLQDDGLTEHDWFFAFQSQGMSGGPWIGPSVEDTMNAVKQSGLPGLVIQPIGFLCDHVEILYDIDIAFQQMARDLGIYLWRPESLNGSPTLISALADLSHTAFARLDHKAPAQDAVEEKVAELA